MGRGEIGRGGSGEMEWYVARHRLIRQHWERKATDKRRTIGRKKRRNQKDTRSLYKIYNVVLSLNWSYILCFAVTPWLHDTDIVLLQGPFLQKVNHTTDYKHGCSLQETSQFFHTFKLNCEWCMHVCMWVFVLSHTSKVCASNIGAYL